MRENVQDESGWDVVYSDGACKGNGKVGSYAGVGVWWGENDPRNIAERCPGDQTNNRAELIAIVRVLETTPKSKKPLLIKTDSQYSINCFQEWLPRWICNKFRTAVGQPVKNLGIIRYLAALFNERELFGQRVHLQYVKGHSGDRGNDGADAQANLGALMPPVPERDWAKAEQDVIKQAEDERRRSMDKPPIVPLQVASDDLPSLAESPTKMRKVSHELPFSRMPALVPPSINTNTPSSSRPMHMARPMSALSPQPPTSPPPPSRIAAVPPSSPSTMMRIPPVSAVNSPAPPLASNSALVPAVLSSPTTTESVSAKASHSATPRKLRNAVEHRPFDSPSRKHGAGFFTNSPPPSKSPRVVKKFADLPSASERARALSLARNLYPPTPEAPGKARSPPPAKPMAMSVNKEDVDINDYRDCPDCLDCRVEDDELSDEH